ASATGSPWVKEAVNLGGHKDRGLAAPQGGQDLLLTLKKDKPWASPKAAILSPLRREIPDHLPHWVARWPTASSSFPAGAPWGSMRVLPVPEVPHDPV